MNFPSSGSFPECLQTDSEPGWSQEPWSPFEFPELVAGAQVVSPTACQVVVWRWIARIHPGTLKGYGYPSGGANCCLYTCPPAPIIWFKIQTGIQVCLQHFPLLNSFRVDSNIIFSLCAEVHFLATSGTLGYYVLVYKSIAPWRGQGCMLNFREVMVLLFWYQHLPLTLNEKLLTQLSQELSSTSACYETCKIELLFAIVDWFASCDW